MRAQCARGATRGRAGCEHEVRHRDAHEGAGQLREDVRGHLPPRNVRRPAASARVTAGLKWAPEIGPNVRISATSAAPVAMVFARSAIATFPPARRSPMMPEPTTVASSRAVPSPSATVRRAKSTCIARRRRQQEGEASTAGWRGARRARSTCCHPPSSRGHRPSPRTATSQSSSSFNGAAHLELRRPAHHLRFCRACR